MCQMDSVDPSIFFFILKSGGGFASPLLRPEGKIHFCGDGDLGAPLTKPAAPGSMEELGAAGLSFVPGIIQSEKQDSEARLCLYGSRHRLSGPVSPSSQEIYPNMAVSPLNPATQKPHCPPRRRRANRAPLLLLSWGCGGLMGGGVSVGEGGDMVGRGGVIFLLTSHNLRGF